MADLADVQQRLWQLITAPSGVGELPADLLQGDERASAEARLSVYANAYLTRIRDVLREDYPALAASLGPDAFHDLVVAYLIAFPPTRPSLRDAGARVAEFLAADTGEAAFFRARWPYARDLAAFEWALVDAFDAPDAPALSREALSGLAPEAWEHLALRLHPAAALLELAWPVQRLREAVDARAALSAAALVPEPTHLCVSRRGERVRFRAVSAQEAELLAGLRAGGRFGALCARLDDAAAAAGYLSRWVEDGLLS
jgi:Putative DNA-binding domain